MLQLRDAYVQKCKVLLKVDLVEYSLETGNMHGYLNSAPAVLT